MKLVVVQHLLHESTSAEIESLVAEAIAASVGGADVIVLPRIASVQDGLDVPRAVHDALADDASAARVLPFGWHGADVEPTPLGSTALLLGDDSLDVGLLDRLRSAGPSAIVMRPAAESAIQAEAFIELALALSLSVAPLVVLAEPVGLDSDGEPAAFGGTCVAIDGELVAEAESETETELLEVDLPELPRFAGPRDPRPELPGILAQRWAHHHGMRAPIDYPADLG